MEEVEGVLTGKVALELERAAPEVFGLVTLESD